MTETLMAVEPSEDESLPAAFAGDQVPVLEPSAEPLVLSSQETELLRGLVRRTRAGGGDVTGPDGLLKQLTKTVIESALEEEMVDHLGYDKHDPTGRNHGNSRNGYRPKISLFAKGLTTGEISAHLLGVYGASVYKDTISRITDKIVEEMTTWWARPLERVYAAIFIDAIVVKVRDGQVANRPFYAAIGVDLDGHKDILGIWPGNSGEGESSKYWLNVLTDLRNRGVVDVFFIVCDGLKGLPDSANTAFPLAKVQTCIIHLIRNTFRYASRKYWEQISRDHKPVYTARPWPRPNRPVTTSWTSGDGPTPLSASCG